MDLRIPLVIQGFDIALILLCDAIFIGACLLIISWSLLMMFAVYVFTLLLEKVSQLTLFKS